MCAIAGVLGKKPNRNYIYWATKMLSVLQHRGHEATGIAPDTVVTVLFNRPVVPLAAIEDLASQPQPLTFVPPVSGEGEWLNTSIYRFTPDDGFEPATEYTARVSSGLSDVSGGTLEDDYVWRFTTDSPRVAATYPDDGSIYVSPTPVISVSFGWRGPERRQEVY